MTDLNLLLEEFEWLVYSDEQQWKMIGGELRPSFRQLIREVFTNADCRYLLKSGDFMRGQLELARMPEYDMEAVPLKYLKDNMGGSGVSIPLATSLIVGIAKLYNELGDQIDGGITPNAVQQAILSAIHGIPPTELSHLMPKTGGTFTGAIQVPDLISTSPNNQAANKGYVDTAVSNAVLSEEPIGSIRFWLPNNLVQIPNGWVRIYFGSDFGFSELRSQNLTITSYQGLYDALVSTNNIGSSGGQFWFKMFPAAITYSGSADPSYPMLFDKLTFIAKYQ